MAHNKSLGPHWRVDVERLDWREWRINELIEDLPFTDLDNRVGRLGDYTGKVLVIAMRDVGCPISKKLGPRLGRLQKAYADRGVQFLYLNCSIQDTRSDMSDDQITYGLGGRYIADEDARLARMLKARSTTDVFVLDASRTLVYRGAVDDQHGIGFVRPTPRTHYLRMAIQAALESRTVEISATRAPGCVIDPDRRGRPETRSSVTYHNRISRIIGASCEPCHRDGGVAPFGLSDYKNVSGRSEMIRFVVRAGIMPPWSLQHDSGPWSNDLSLSKRDREDLLAWIKAGAPEGDPRDGQPPRSWSSDWQYGKPDVVVELPEPIDIPAEGVLDYVKVSIPLMFAEDKWIERIEVRPTAPQHVHHILAWLIEPPGTVKPARRRLASGGPLGSIIAAYTPGQSAVTMPSGTAVRIPRNTWLKLQIHYVTNGKRAKDQTRIGIVFADDKPVWPLMVSTAYNMDLDIPAGASSHKVTAEHRFETPAVMVGFGPHMHYRGKAIRYDLIHPDGTSRELLHVPRYDFNWQHIYWPREPVSAPAGSVLRVTGWFDNSTNNPANPDPTQRVKWGLQAFDEMLVGYVIWHPPFPKEKR